MHVTLPFQLGKNVQKLIIAIRGHYFEFYETKCQVLSILEMYQTVVFLGFHFVVGLLKNTPSKSVCFNYFPTLSPNFQ